MGCRLERSRVWAARCMHEAQMHERNAFITLTYDPEHLPGQSLQHRDFQIFMKRLRNLQAKALGKGGKVSFYMAGEYGSVNRRPHFHACIFGWEPSDGLYYQTTPTGNKLYTSDTLDKLWGNKGFASYGEVTFESAAYIARYIMAKVTGQLAEIHYTDEKTGEKIKPEYNKMSLRPAIGKKWLDVYKDDVYPEGEVLTRNIKTKSPKYYDKQYKKIEPEKYDQMKADRELLATKYAQDNTEERLRAKEEVKRAALRALKRNI